VRLYEAQGYGAAINYEIAAPLLADAAAALADAAASPPGQPAPQRARLMFAHCETLVPLASLLGLWRPPPGEMPPLPAEALKAIPITPAQAAAELAAADSPDDLALRLAREVAAAALSPRAPPAAAASALRYKGRTLAAAPLPDGWAPRFGLDGGRTWRSGMISPLGANLALVLYRRTAPGGGGPDHLVRLLYNEQVVPLPGCAGAGAAGGPDCPLDAFLAAAAEATGGSGAAVAAGDVPGRPAACDVIADGGGGGAAGGAAGGDVRRLRADAAY